MFSYRHAFHCGNHADVLKHTALLAVLNYMTEKAVGITVLDSHAGAGLYRLDGQYARTSQESDEGVLRLLQAQQNKEVEFVYKNLSKNNQMYEIELENGDILNITGNHKVLLKTNIWKRVDELDISDEIIFYGTDI
mgnify:CR=1 FL=1